MALGHFCRTNPEQISGVFFMYILINIVILMTQLGIQALSPTHTLMGHILDILQQQTKCITICGMKCYVLGNTQL